MTGCDCDRLVHPEPLRIAAGLSTLPRQVGTFAEFRRALLASVPAGGPLSRWRPGNAGDLGSMLLEAWAYVCDVQSFYDETIAHEDYLRTARLRPSLRRLVGLLGYVPKPATAASVDLALLADGRKPVSLPAGTGFRSGAFDDEAPQVFELSAKMSVHPLTSKWSLEWPRPVTLGIASPSSLLLEPDTADLEEGDLVLAQDLDAVGRNRLAQVASVEEDFTGADGESYAKVEFVEPLGFAASTKVASVRLLKPGATLSLRKETGLTVGALIPAVITAQAQLQGAQQNIVQRAQVAQGASSAAQRAVVSSQATLAAAASGGSSSISSESGRGVITLDGLHRQIKPGDFIGMTLDDDRRWYRVIENREVQLTVSAPPSFTVGDDTVNPPPVTAPFTRIVLDVTVDSSTRFPDRASNWSSNSSIANRLVVHYGFEPAGEAAVEARTIITGSDSLRFEPPVETPADGTSPGRFLMQDRDEDGLLSGGEADLAARTLTLDPGADFGDGLRLPVNVYGNVVTATRGETVPNETLGTGDASIPGQSFTLKKSPLTYVPAPSSGNESGVASTLQIRVNGILWKEVPYLFGQAPGVEVYTVRQDDEDASTVRFGDGVNGSRLPTGAPVTATYRYGAGSATPSAGSITQMAKAVKGITAVKNPVAAYGGSDAEDAENIREYAPGSALTLGRAVSISDMEAVAAGVPGVRAVKAEWTWHEKRQRPVAYIWYIGDAGIEASVGDTVRSVSDPSTPIEVARATSIPLHLAIDIEIDSRYVEADVLAEVRANLISEDDGLLLPENLGIGAPIFRSRLFESVLEPEGAEAVHGIQFKREDPPSLVALRPYRAQLMRIQSLLAAPAATLAGGLSLAAPVAPPASISIGSGRAPTVITAELAVATKDLDSFVLSAPSGHYFDIVAGSLRLNGEEGEDA